MPAPLVARWFSYTLAEAHAGAVGTATAELENAGSVAWNSPPEVGEGIRVSYHWLDELGNPIVWDGVRTRLAHPVAPGERVSVELQVRAPIPPGRYRLMLDLVDERRAWFSDLGNEAPQFTVDVLPRIERRLAARGGDPGALAAQEEPLVPEDEAEAIAYLCDGCAPEPDWSRRVLDAHQEGYAVVGGSIELATGFLRRRPATLDPYVSEAGRVPGFPHPLVCPSHVRGLTPDMSEQVAGLPAARAPAGEPSLYDGRIVVTAPLRSGRRRA